MNRRTARSLFPLLLTSSLTLMAADAYAYIRTSPGMPRSGDAITLEVGGIWPSSGVPTAPSVRREGSIIEISLRRGGGGLSAVSPWSYRLHLGAGLAVGTHTVRVVIDGRPAESADFVVLSQDPRFPVLLPGYTSDPHPGAGAARYESALFSTGGYALLYPGGRSGDELVDQYVMRERLPRIADPSGTSTGAGRLLWISPHAYVHEDEHVDVRFAHTLTSSRAHGPAHYASFPAVHVSSMHTGDFLIAGIPVADHERFRYLLRVYHLGLRGTGRVSVVVEGPFGESFELPVDRVDYDDRSYPSYTSLSLDRVIARPFEHPPGYWPEFISVSIRPETPGLYYALVTMTEKESSRVVPFAPPTPVEWE